MKNIHLSVLGSNSFLDILNELEFNNILNSNSQSNQSTKELHIKILFVGRLANNNYSKIFLNLIFLF